ncbi:beta-ribofuranosylaminobenzene 5'-phosphate synthase [Sulfolobales archaeon HS-7]|nr:beta-ribofuranosylaminobenzene 5'-phosphate synthase [Sulfolobales archaeon HS-7]
MLKIIGLSRIHITLIDLEGKYGRIDGGIGLALSNPKIVISDGNCSTDHLGVSYCLEEDYPSHVGLGHTTQVRMAISSLYLAKRGEYFKSEKIIKLSGRGGTSGVGIYAFIHGGLIVDGGHSTKVKPKPLPSDFSPAPPPPLLIRLNFPWKIYLNIPEGKRVFGKEELQAFKREVSGIGDLSRVIFLKLLPAVIERDLSDVLDAISLIQRLGFKRIEVEMQSEKVKELMRLMEKKGFHPGISSFGPCIYTFVQSRKEGEELVSRFGGFITEPNNNGAKILKA